MAHLTGFLLEEIRFWISAPYCISSYTLPWVTFPNQHVPFSLCQPSFGYLLLSLFLLHCFLGLVWTSPSQTASLCSLMSGVLSCLSSEDFILLCFNLRTTLWSRLGLKAYWTQGGLMAMWGIWTRVSEILVWCCLSWTTSALASPTLYSPLCHILTLCLSFPELLVQSCLVHLLWMLSPLGSFSFMNLYPVSVGQKPFKAINIKNPW